MGGGGPQESECCAHDDCEGAQGFPARCAAFSVGYCGGAAPPEANVCHRGQCADDGDCEAGRACIPLGFGGLIVPACLPARCRADGDCQERAQGQCRPLKTGAMCPRLEGFSCTYADDPCRADVDCPRGDVCAWDDATGRPICAELGPPPP